MKSILIASLVLLSSTTFGLAQYYGTGSNPNGHYVQPHLNNNGSYTSGHYSSNPNHTQTDNWSTQGNVNPYTGQVGTRQPRY